jgi:ABC-2 type transport system ATP-binding protein
MTTSTQNSENKNENIIEVKNLVKKFGEIEAVKDISFSVKRGQIFAFLGPNGAGKTTTIRMLTTMLHPTSDRKSVV